MALGVTVTTRTAPPAGGAIPTATDAWFVAGVTDAGTLSEPVEVRDMATFESEFAGRTAGNIELWDALDFFFRSRASREFVLEREPRANLRRERAWPSRQNEQRAALERSSGDPRRGSYGSDRQLSNLVSRGIRR